MARVSPRGPCLAVASAALAMLGAGGCGGGGSTTSSGSTASSPTRSPAPTSTASTAAQPAVVPSSAGAHTVRASAGGVTATMHAGTHQPKVDRPWPIHFSVTRGGHDVRASVDYEYLFGNQVVAHRSHYTFTGRFSDVFTWPSSAVGFPLTFRAVIRSAGASINLDYQVQVAR